MSIEGFHTGAGRTAAIPHRRGGDGIADCRQCAAGTAVPLP